MRLKITVLALRLSSWRKKCSCGLREATIDPSECVCTRIRAPFAKGNFNNGTHSLKDSL